MLDGQEHEYDDKKVHCIHNVGFVKPTNFGMLVIGYNLITYSFDKTNSFTPVMKSIQLRRRMDGLILSCFWKFLRMHIKKITFHTNYRTLVQIQLDNSIDIEI